MITSSLTLQSQGVKNYWSPDGLWFQLTIVCSVLLPLICAKKFEDEHDFKMDLKNFFSQKSQDFYKRGILSLPERSRQIIDSNGAFIIET
jgi:hypothetical protein